MGMGGERENCMSTMCVFMCSCVRPDVIISEVTAGL